MTAPIHRMDNNSPPEDFVAAQLSLLAIRGSELADQVTRNEIGFIDAVDLAYSAAQWSGLTDRAGDDAVQKILAACFGGIGAEDRRRS